MVADHAHPGQLSMPPFASTEEDALDTTALVSVTPETGAPGSSVLLTITGVSTTFSSGPFEVENVWLRKGSLRIEGTSVQLLGNTRLQARFAIPSAAEYLGRYDVSVEQPRGIGVVTLVEGFTVTGTSGVEPGSRGRIIRIPPARMSLD